MAALRAAGGVLWDVHETVLRIAIIRRPRYDDWSLPKGKLTPGEHVLLAGVREIEEETGYSCRIGRSLGEVQYTKQTSAGPTPKTVHYWACRAGTGRFSPNDEVDELLWLRPKDAARLATLDRDRDVIGRFIARPVDTVPFILLRHGSAGQRGSWPGDDRERPLDEVGQRQADALVDLLDCYGIERVLSADVVRCVDTVRPYAVKHGLTVESEPLLSETGFPQGPKAAIRRIAALVSEARPTVLCSQGGVIGDLVTALCQTYGHKVPSDPSARKGMFWAMHLAGDEMVGLEKQSALPS